MSRKTFVLHPGYVTSATDGELHYVNSRDLARLYRIPYSECEVIWDEQDDLYYYVGPDFVHLSPRHDGNYSILNGYTVIDFLDAVDKHLRSS